MYLDDQEECTMKDKNFSWKGSPNAGVVLIILAGVGGLLVFLLGFSN